VLGLALVVATSAACDSHDIKIATVARINASAGAYTTPAGTPFSADKGFVGGSSSGTSTANIAGTDADRLYANHRWGMSGYRVAVPAKGVYIVRLHFAETVFRQAGKRVFDVTAENRLQINDLDVFRSAGADAAHVRQFSVAVSDGTLDIGFGRVVEDPMISGIEVHSLQITARGTAPQVGSPPPPAKAAPSATTAPPVPKASVTPAPTAPTTPPASGGRPTASNTGPTVANPKSLGRVEVTGVTNLSDVEVGSIFVRPGGQLTATNVRVTGTIVVESRVGAAKTKAHLTNVAAHRGMVVNVQDSVGNLHWGGEVPVDVVVRDSFLYYPQGNLANGDHTEALAGFGWPQGARFEHTSMVQQGPMNGTATATINWHGTDTVFDTVWFDWDGPAAAHFTVYVEGRNNVVRNSYFASTGGYVYPGSSPQATYTNNRDLHSGASLNLPG